MRDTIRETRICLACNEDGYGPSAFGFYIARELMRAWQERGEQLQLVILNRSAESFNRSLYSGSLVKIQPVDSLIKIQKEQGEIHVPKTLNSLRQYATRRTTYTNEVYQWLNGCDIAIDIGVPLFTRAAHQFGVPHRVPIFDHSWAATLRLMAAKEWKHLYRNTPVPGPADRALADQLSQTKRREDSSRIHYLVMVCFRCPCTAASTNCVPLSCSCLLELPHLSVRFPSRIARNPFSNTLSEPMDPKLCYNRK
jgi:hypothetical protein